ncbi:hypothetical protein Q4E93_32805 [Flavitalea sp. BT771]|uniref:hypothetical protein n=1 Tax=Flavitalea sp. BT771 TaxID=3063329 RepID=UPI0026E203F3|nr:hypothetical protein [Flavitalea sp. BT771]MDO6435440.1 hypothetical protein [Flavitalea sp. BT771]MDV6224200.1 hypothetical protein [Flavitalea sp. BT771]
MTRPPRICSSRMRLFKGLAILLPFLDPTFYSIEGKLAAALVQQEKANNYLGRAAHL